MEQERIEKVEETNLQLMQENFDISNRLELAERTIASFMESIVKLTERILVLEGTLNKNEDKLENLEKDLERYGILPDKETRKEVDKSLE